MASLLEIRHTQKHGAGDIWDVFVHIAFTKHGWEDFLTRNLGQRWHVEGFPLPEGSREEHWWHGSTAQHQCPEVLLCSRLGGARDAHVLACVLWLLPSAWVVECALKQLQAHEHDASLQKCNL